MENKKQLIIIPPMSEALKKLNEVLEGISGDENVEISIIDDLKELSQFIATTGQCLILVSNAKKCATFLQDNKFMLAKNHCKTILFTPKEIPAKTLVKFTKIGLTESILENSPPKTFLYKVKLLLRSIKTAKPQEDAEKLVKSLEAGKVTAEENAEREVKDKITAEENVIDMDTAKKKKRDDSGETIDYGANLKGKIKPQEEVLETHWKSNRKKDGASQEATEEENMAAESELASIDMYYRGKRKKIDDLLETQDDDFKKLNKTEITEEELEKKKKSSYADVIDEGSMKQKKIDQLAEESNLEEKKASSQLDLVNGEQKPRKAENVEEDFDLGIKKNKNLDLLDGEKPKTKDAEVEDLGGHLKGKVTKTQELFEEPEIKDEEDYDNSEIEEEGRSEDFDLNLEAADKKARKKDNQDANEDNIHDAEVDKIGNNMIGDAGTVDKIRTRMNGSIDPDALPDEEEGTDLSFSGKREKTEKNSEDESDSDSLNLEAATADETKKNEVENTQNDEELDLSKSETKLDLLLGEKERKSKEASESDDNSRQRSAAIEKIKEDKQRNSENSQSDDDALLGVRSLDKSGIKASKERNQTHEAQVDKIDTFYRGGESKKQEHNWDNLSDKKTTLDLIAGEKKSGLSTVAAENKEYSETTIDYRKLKEEFDMIASGGAISESGAFRTSHNTSLKNDDDEGSFKVVEIDPKGLDFSIGIVNSIYNKDVKAKQIFAMIADELVTGHHCYPVFYTYKLSDKKFTEVFNSFIEMNGTKMPIEKKEWWNEFKKDTLLFEHYQNKSMTTWRAPEIINNGEIWEDVELPSWADQELKTKKVELIFPYFDGIDRMGLAVVFFPDGLDPKNANGLLTVLETARSLFLDTIQRYQVGPVKEIDITNASESSKKEEKKNVLSFFGGLFGKKKAG